MLSAKRQFKIGRRSLKVRSCVGVYLIEFLVALAVSTLIAGFLIDDISQINRFSTNGEMQLMATSIAQEVIDSARNQPYTTLQALIGTHVLPVNSGDGSFDSSFPRPLLLDLQNLSWSQASQRGKFYGTVTETIAYSPLVSNTISITVVVQWKEGASTTRTYKISTLVSQFGVHG